MARTKYCPEIVAEITNDIRNLRGRCVAAENAGIDYQTFTNWMDKHSEFSDAIKEAERAAREKGKNTAVMSIFKAMPNQWQSAAWWLERNHDEFIKKEKSEQTHILPKPIMDVLEDHSNKKDSETG